MAVNCPGNVFHKKNLALINLFTTMLPSNILVRQTEKYNRPSSGTLTKPFDSHLIRVLLSEKVQEMQILSTSNRIHNRGHQQNGQSCLLPVDSCHGTTIVLLFSPKISRNTFRNHQVNNNFFNEMSSFYRPFKQGCISFLINDTICIMIHFNRYLIHIMVQISPYFSMNILKQYLVLMKVSYI